MQAMFTANITSQKPYDDLVSALRWMQRQAAETAAAAARASQAAGPEAKDGSSCMDAQGGSSGDGVGSSCDSGGHSSGTARPLLFMEGRAAGPTPHSKSQQGISKLPPSESGSSSGGQGAGAKGGSKTQGHVAVQAHGDMPLTLWQIQAVYNVLKGLDHPEAPAFGKVRWAACSY